VASSPLARAAGLTALLAVLGTGAATTALPGTHVGGLWPVGLASGLLLTCAAGDRGVPRLAPPAALVVVTAATFLVAGSSLTTALGYAASVLALALVTTVVLARRGSTGDDLDLVGYLAASSAGALVGATGFALTSVAGGVGVPSQVFLAALTAQLASQLTLVPLFLAPIGMGGSVGRREQALRWGLALVVAVLAFVPTDVPVLVFIVPALLGWTAMRASVREVLWLLIVTGAATTVAASSRSEPFLGRSDGRVPADLAAVPHHAFLVGCALVCIPFAMTARRRRASEVAARRAHRRYERLLRASTGVSIVECDEIGRITLVNPGCEVLLGWSQDELVGKFPDVFHTDEEIARQAAALGCPPDLMNVSLAMAEPGVGARDWRFVRKDGEERTFSMRIEPITDERGVAVGYLSTAEDVTEGVRTREALVTALEAERRAVARLTAVDHTKDAFVSSVSHELRTPITNIVGYLELLLDGAYGETTALQHEALSRIDLNSHRLLELIDDLLTLSSIESLDVDISREPIDLRGVAERAAARLRPTSLARNQQLDVVVPAGPAVVLGDGQHLERMLDNLADNAVKFTPDGGSVAVRVLEQDGCFALEVSDTGMGISTEEQPQLFNRFFRTATAQRAAIRGSGLGLSIARSIAELHGARISASSSPGEGSVFRVEFPDARVHRQRDRRSRRPQD
jgi:PAS domain S-box-containing protein